VSAVASSAPNTAARVRRLIAIVAVFIAVGPPVGALAFILSTALIGMGMKVDLAGLTWIGLFALIYAVPLSYMIGVLPAGAVGLLVGIRQAWFGAISWPFALGIGLAAGAALLLLSGQPVIPRAGSDTVQPVHMPILFATCLSATLACWAIVRKWVFESVSVSGAQT
jgi:hypothetical protein